MLPREVGSREGGSVSVIVSVSVSVCVEGPGGGRWDRKVLSEGLQSPSSPIGPLASHLDITPEHALGSPSTLWNTLSQLRQGAAGLRCSLSWKVWGPASDQANGRTGPFS